LAASCALSAGVMIYVSFIEIFQKSVMAFEEQEVSWAYLAATSCFFAGFIITKVFDIIVHSMTGQNCSTAEHSHSSLTDNNDNNCQVQDEEHQQDENNNKVNFNNESNNNNVNFNKEGCEIKESNNNCDDGCNENN